jgi:hypothetical protein
MNESIPPELEVLLQAERAAADQTTARRDHVRRRLESSIAVVALGTAVGVAVGTTSAALGGTSAIARIAERATRLFVRGKMTTVLVAASVGAAGGGAVGYQAGTRTAETRQVQDAPRASSSVQRSAASVVGSAIAEPTVPSRPTSEAITPAPMAKPSVSASARLGEAERDTKLAEELTLVQTARTALVRGDAASALDTADTHRRRFPSGRLAEERESVAIQALARLGQGDEARRRATDFERRYPTSVFLPVVARALRSIP